MLVEEVGIVVVVLVGVSLLASSSTSLRTSIPVCLLFAGVGMAGERYRRSLAVAARQAKLAPDIIKRKTTTPASTTETKLPQTVNKRASVQSSSTNKSPPSAGTPTEPQALPQTKNPRKIETSPPDEVQSRETPSVASTPPPNPNAPWANVGSVNGFAYTLQAQQMRRDEYQFRPVIDYQASDARERMLNSLYKELIDVSVKKDPALRLPESSSDPCEPLRGLTVPHIVP